MKYLKILFVFGVIGLMAQDLKQMYYFVDREMFSKAKAVVREQMQKSPSNVDLYFFMGDIDFKNDKLDSARYWFMEGLKKNEKCALCYVGMGKVSMEKNPTEGKANFDKAISLSPKDARVYAAIGDYWISLDKPDGKKGVEVLNKATELDAKNLSYKLMLGDAYRYSFEGSKGMSLYKEVLAKDTTSPLPYWKIGRLYLGAQNYELGKENFSKGLAKDPNFAPLYREYGELYKQWRKYDKAIENYKKYLDLRDKSDDTDYRYASFLFLSKNYKDAAAILSTLEKKGYANPILYRLLAYSAYENKDYASAAKYMDMHWQKISGDKIIASDYEYQGKILIRNGKDVDGIAALQKAVDLDSTKKSFYKEVSDIFNELSKPEQAQQYFQLYLATGKGTYNDYYNFGKASYNNQRYTTADSAFMKVVELRPELPHGYLWRARSNTNLDPNSDKGLAKPFYEKYIEIASKEVAKNKDGLIEAYSYLGSYYIYTEKNKAKAQEAWNNVKVHDPESKAVVEAEKQLKLMK